MKNKNKTLVGRDDDGRRDNRVNNKGPEKPQHPSAFGLNCASGLRQTQNRQRLVLLPSKTRACNQLDL